MPTRLAGREEVRWTPAFRHVTLLALGRPMAEGDVPAG
jgi:hypothetical protein